MSIALNDDSKACILIVKSLWCIVQTAEKEDLHIQTNINVTSKAPRQPHTGKNQTLIYLSYYSMMAVTLLA
jgi:hypothetical protein